MQCLSLVTDTKLISNGQHNFNNERKHITLRKHRHTQKILVEPSANPLIDGHIDTHTVPLDTEQQIVNKNEQNPNNNGTTNTPEITLLRSKRTRRPPIRYHYEQT